MAVFYEVARRCQNGLGEIYNTEERTRCVGARAREQSWCVDPTAIPPVGPARIGRVLLKSVLSSLENLGPTDAPSQIPFVCPIHVPSLCSPPHRWDRPSLTWLMPSLLSGASFPHRLLLSDGQSNFIK